MTTKRQPYRIVVADDHLLIRQGLVSIITQDAELEIVGEAGDGDELLEVVAKTRPDMVILDISMPRKSGLSALKDLRADYPDIAILILSMHRSRLYFFEAIASGAQGYLLKDDPERELLAAIATVRSGSVYISPGLAQEVTDDMVRLVQGQSAEPLVHLTNREKEVLHLVVQGHTSKKIAEILCLSPRTVEHHRANLLKKFGVRSTLDLIKHAIGKGLVSVDE